MPRREHQFPRTAMDYIPRYDGIIVWERKRKYKRRTLIEKISMWRRGFRGDQYLNEITLAPEWDWYWELFMSAN